MTHARQAPGGQPYSDEMLAACDPGIRAVVKWLNAHGFETSDSGDGRWKWRCDGCGAQPGETHGRTSACGRRAGKARVRAEDGEGLALPYPHVFIDVERPHTGIDVADRLARELRQAGVIVVQIGEMFDPGAGDTPAGAWIQLTYDPVTESCMIELAHLDDAHLRAAGVIP